MISNERAAIVHTYAPPLIIWYIIETLFYTRTQVVCDNVVLTQFKIACADLPLGILGLPNLLLTKLWNQLDASSIVLRRQFQNR